jgi:hypothetical protein
MDGDKAKLAERLAGHDTLAGIVRRKNLVNLGASRLDSDSDG